MTDNAAGKGDGDRRDREKFDPNWDEYETHNEERLRELRESFRKRKDGRR